MTKKTNKCAFFHCLFSDVPVFTGFIQLKAREHFVVVNCDVKKKKKTKKKKIIS